MDGPRQTTEDVMKIIYENYKKDRKEFMGEFAIMPDYGRKVVTDEEFAEMEKLGIPTASTVKLSLWKRGK